MSSSYWPPAFLKPRDARGPRCARSTCSALLHYCHIVAFVLWPVANILYKVAQTDFSRMALRSLLPSHIAISTFMNIYGETRQVCVITGAAWEGWKYVGRRTCVHAGFMVSLLYMHYVSGALWACGWAAWGIDACCRLRNQRSQEEPAGEETASPEQTANKSNEMEVHNLDGAKKIVELSVTLTKEIPKQFCSKINIGRDVKSPPNTFVAKAAFWAEIWGDTFGMILLCPIY